jgi:CPA2 family monovalent cation:H+ antiporter-2
MPDHSLVRDLVLTYALALGAVIASARFKVPPIVALIAAGTLAGPSAIGIVSTQEEVETLAEMGIVLLLFTVGLDFSLAEIRRIWKAIVGGGTLQVLGTTALVIVAFLAGLASLRLGLFVGLFVALSSTAIVLKELTERNQMDSPAGRLAVGVLLLQDVFVVVLLLVVPMLSGETPVAAIPRVLGKALIALVALAAISRLVLPRLLRVVTRSGRREAFPLAVVLASIGTAWLASTMGISMALGAFLGGLVLAGSEFSHQAHAEVRPLRDILAGLFFISLGMLVDLAEVVRLLPLIVAAALGIILIKTIGAGAALLAVGTPLRVAVTAGLYLAQVGEFSFVLGRAGLRAGLLTDTLWQVLLGASIATMVVTPALVGAGPKVGAWLAARTGRRAPRDTEGAGVPKMSDHVIILGFGMGGRLFAQGLREFGVPYLILELNGATVREAREKGELIFYGDAAHPDALEAAGIEHARAVVAVLSDPDASARTLRAIRSHAPHVPVIIRVRYREEARRMLAMGANVAIAEELEGSLETLGQLLVRLGVPGNLAQVHVERLRGPDSVRGIAAPRVPLGAMPVELRNLPVATHQLGPVDWSVGKTLALVNLRAETGASVLAVRRDSQYHTSPSADFVLSGADVLYLLGDESDILLARHRLTAGDGGTRQPDAR